MTYIWDTNILLYVLRKSEFLDTLKLEYNLDASLSQISISAVTVGEIHAIALRNRRGEKRVLALSNLLDSLKIIFIDDNPFLIQMYAEIDTYSQNQHPNLKMPTSAVKMGKNDLWIAATTAIFNATLISTDNDFNHLKNLFFSFDKIIV